MKRLIKRLRYLRRKCGLVAIKGGTEVEDMTFDEIAFFKTIGDPILPIIVKIGGPEARNDIRTLKDIGVQVLLAPMIESEYALRNFVESVQDIYRGVDLPLLSINIETITAYKNLHRIAADDHFRFIYQVTVGRSDLSASMHMKNDDDEVYRATESIVSLSRDMGKVTSVGGKITAVNARAIHDRVKPHRINTRHMIFDLSLCRDIAESVNFGLEFEMELYSALTEVEPAKHAVYARLVENTRARLQINELSRRAG